MSDSRPTDDELLAAYADSGLDPRQTARLDARTGADPTAAAEVAGLRQTINAVRAAQPRPAAEPAWDEMARAIRAACDPLPAPRTRASWLGLLLRPRVAAPILALAAAATIALVFANRPASPVPPPQPLVAASDPPAGQHQPPDTDLTPLDTELPVPEVSALDDGQLDAVLAALDDVPDLSGDTPADDSSTDDTAVGLFGDDAYASWVDDLDESQLDDAAAYLATQPG